MKEHAFFTRPTVRIPLDELEVLLHVEQAAAQREKAHTRPTVQMPAVVATITKGKQE